jgi:hypothetical protein
MGLFVSLYLQAIAGERDIKADPSIELAFPQGLKPTLILMDSCTG